MCIGCHGQAGRATEPKDKSGCCGCEEMERALGEESASLVSSYVQRKTVQLPPSCDCLAVSTKLEQQHQTGHGVVARDYGPLFYHIECTRAIQWHQYITSVLHHVNKALELKCLRVAGYREDRRRRRGNRRNTNTGIIMRRRRIRFMYIYINFDFNNGQLVGWFVD